MAAIPSLRAEESLAGIADHRSAAFPVKKATARTHVRSLERAAAAHRRKRPADPRRLRAAGIAVERREG